MADVAVQPPPVMMSLEDSAFDAVSPLEMFKFLADVWGSAIQKLYWPKLKERLTLQQMESFSRTLSWDHPAARDLDKTVHKRRMQGKSVFFVFSFTPTVYEWGFIFFLLDT